MRRSQIIRRTGGLFPGFFNPENFVISDSNSSHDDSGFSPDSPVHGGERITSKFPLSTAKYSNPQTTQAVQPVSGVPPKRAIQHIPSKQIQSAVYEGLATVPNERPGMFIALPDLAHGYKQLLQAYANMVSSPTSCFSPRIRYDHRLEKEIHGQI